MARWIDSWMPGAAAAPDARSSGNHPGERLGLPATGAGAVAGFGRRLAALTVDWLLGYLIAAIVANPDPGIDPLFSWYVMGIWIVLTALPVAVFGASAGQTLLGIRVASLGEVAVIGVPRALLRTLLIAVVVPPLVRDRDGRGWHDRAVRTVVVRTRG